MIPRVTGLASIQVRFIVSISSRPLKPVPAGHGYTVEIESLSNIVTIGPGATRGLAVHPVGTSPFTLDAHPPALTLLRTVAAVVTFIALLSSLSSHVMLVMLAMLLSFLAAFLTLIAFAIDISLFVILRNRVHSLGNVEGHTFAGPGMETTLFPFSVADT